MSITASLTASHIAQRKQIDALIARQRKSDRAEAFEQLADVHAEIATTAAPHDQRVSDAETSLTAAETAAAKMISDARETLAEARRQRNVALSELELRRDQLTYAIEFELLPTELIEARETLQRQIDRLEVPAASLPTDGPEPTAALQALQDYHHDASELRSKLRALDALTLKPDAEIAAGLQKLLA